MFDNMVFWCIIIPLCIYIASVAVVRLASMGWHTHRRGWQIIYLLMAMSAASNAMVGSINADANVFLVAGLLAAAMWFYESRNRWRDGPPDYMKV